MPLGAYFCLVPLLPPLRASLWRPQYGQVTLFGTGAAILIAAVSCGALIRFQATMHPDVRPYSHMIPVRAFASFTIFGIYCSVLNAFLEELIFRGVLFDSIASQWGRWMAVCGSAALFGYAHLHGYPPGPLGAVLAGLYGIALGWLRLFTHGIGLPIAAHIVADATIFSLLAHSQVP